MIVEKSKPKQIVKAALVMLENACRLCGTAVKFLHKDCLEEIVSYNSQAKSRERHQKLEELANTKSCSSDRARINFEEQFLGSCHWHMQQLGYASGLSTLSSTKISDLSSNFVGRKFSGEMYIGRNVLVFTKGS